jgi:bla regulator protein BlaR1
MKKLILMPLLFILWLACASCAPAASNRFLELDASTQGKIHQAIREALIDTTIDNYYELKTEGHVILDAETKENKLFVYMIECNSGYEFTDGRFTGGCQPAWLVPALAVFSETETYGPVTLNVEVTNVYGEVDENWLKENFPAALHETARHYADAYDEIQKQMDEQANAYLKSIGRADALGADVKEIVWLNEQMPKEAYALLEETKLLDEYPVWVGNKEKLENNIRYVYETAVKKDTSDHTLVVFTKKRYDNGDIMELRQFRVTGDTIEEVPAC